MPRLAFPLPFKHDRSPVRKVNEIVQERLTLGQRAADWAALTVGSWQFIFTQALSAGRMGCAQRHGDHCPLEPLSVHSHEPGSVAAGCVPAPIIMVSQNRQAMRDRIDAQYGYELNRKAEHEVRAVLGYRAAHDYALGEIRRLFTISSGTSNSRNDHRS